MSIHAKRNVTQTVTSVVGTCEGVAVEGGEGYTKEPI